jgi:ABC-type uncharacterized transport system permease subunit
MASSIILSLAALMALVPAAVLPLRREATGPDLLFWTAVVVAVSGPGAYVVVLLGGGWTTGLAPALWVSIAVSIVLFAILSLASREGWRLRPLLLPYLILLGVIATVWGRVPAQGALTAAPDAWLTLHIVASVATYGLCTLAAMAAAAAFLQERALKSKRPTALSRVLPSISDASFLQVRLLAVSEAVLALGIASGMARDYLNSGQLLHLDHKTLLAMFAFLVIGALLLAHRRSGLRGQRAARLVLLAYLLLTLAYPGVKFVTDVLIG